MSLINQVLSDLEKRGANALPGEASIRVVPVQRNRFRMTLLVVAVLTLVFMVTKLWLSSSQPKTAASVSVAQAPATKPVAAPQAESQPVAVVVREARQEDSGQEESGQKNGGEVAGPAMRLSFELSSIPLPSSLRAGPVSQPTPVQTAIQPVEPVRPVQAVVPTISSVSPDPVIATGKTQPLVINGSNFAKGATVTLRTGGKMYANRPVSSLSPAQILIKPNLGKSPDTWSVEVINPIGASSGLFMFEVQLPAGAPTGSGSGKQVAATGKNKMPVATPTPAEPVGGVDKQIKQVNVQQQADNEFRKAGGLMQQGRIDEALAGYEAALRLDAGHDEARQALVGLLLKNKRNADAESVLQDGLKHNPRHSGFAMLLARLQVERDALSLALDTLQKTLPYADQQADYQAFVAALLQRQNRHKEAITHYQVALQLSPNSGVWLMGLGISLQAVQRNEEARDAFKRAIESGNLSAELQAFVRQRLKEL